MIGNTPKYWGSWEGKIITALVNSENNSISWETLLKQTGLTGFQLRSAIATLFDARVIAKEELETEYHLADEKLGKEYAFYVNNYNQNMFEEKPATPQETIVRDVMTALKETQKGIKKPSNNQKWDLIQWINQWGNIRNLEFSMENMHFFLSGLDLDDFIKQVILEAKDTILIVNPCLENCYLTITLEHVVKKGVKVKVVTRPAVLGEVNYDKKQDCHSPEKFRCFCK